MNGNLNLASGGAGNGAGTISGKITSSGNTTVNLGGQAAFNVLATLPPAFVTGQLSSSLITIGNTTYNVSQVDFVVSGNAQAFVSGSALGAFAQFGLSATPTAEDGTALGGTATASVQAGSGFSTFPSLLLPLTADAEMTLGGGALLVSVFDISTHMSADLQLSTGSPNSNTATLDAFDPFSITSMELLDANGVPIPGVTFVADDGTIIADAADMATPIPATLPLFATGLGAMGLFGWRRKRKNAASIAAA